MATRATRAKPSVVPPPEDRSKNARFRKLQKPNTKTVTFEDEDDEGESTDDEEVDIESEKSHVASEKLLLRPSNHGTGKDLPFQGVPALAYVPLGKNLRPAREVNHDNNDQGPAFHNKAPIDTPKPESVVPKVLEAPITLTLGDLLKSDKGVREGLRKLLTKRRVPSNERAINLIDAMNEEQFAYWRSYAELHDLDDIVSASELPPVRVLMASTNQCRLPEGTLVVSDPVLQYLEAIPPGGTAKPVYVAQESQSLRTIHAVVNGSSEEECILDGGSQIVSMSKAVAVRLGLPWDPEICIHMQSANNQIEKSLGLVRNVPFRFDHITVYLQVHVINEPAYKVLLGRPFDAVTCSIYENDRDGGQIVIIQCPNTKKKITIPTRERGKDPDVLQKKVVQSTATCTDFRSSMIWSDAGEN
jgi:Aspartyl protease